MKILILTHYLNNKGAIDRYGDYLISQAHDVYKLAHYLDYYAGKPTILIRSNKPIKQLNRRKIGLLNLFLDIKINIKYIKSLKPEKIIASNNFDTLSAKLAQMLTKYKVDIIYFASDFSEERFNNRVLDWIYFIVERVAIRSSKYVISNTYRSETQRKKLGLTSEKSIIIPNGTILSNPIFNKKTINKNNFIYQGSVTKEHGLYDLLTILQPLIKKFVLIGGGDDWDRVINFCNENNVNYEAHKNKTHEFVVEYLQKFNGIGLAPYNLESKWTYYSSPLKIVDYITAVVPVLMSEVPEMAEECVKKGLGVAYSELEFNEIAQKLEQFNLKGFELRAKEFYDKYNSNVLYSKIKL